MARVSRVTTPSDPSETTLPGNVAGSSSREIVTSSPSARTMSIARTAVDRLPLRSPDPWVPVAQAPATEMCGSEARLWRAKPAACRTGARSP